MSNVKQLSSLCIYCIAKNFNRFMFAYTSGNFISKVYFEFLQRQYSAPLLERLLCLEEFEDYIDFLLNPFLKEVELYDYSHNIELIINRLIDIGQTITLLNLPHSNYEDSSLEKLFSSLTNVEILGLNGENISLDVFRSIGNNCRNLKALISSCPDITDEHIEALYVPSDEEVNECNLSTNLEKLISYNGDITIRGLKYALKNFRNMQLLDHDDNENDVFRAIYELHANDTNSNDHLREYKLQQLIIWDAKNYPVEFLELSGRLLPHVTELEIGDINSQAQTDALKTFSSLEKLNIEFLNNSCDLSPFLAKNGSNLKQLTIEGGIISLNNLLKFCPKLEKLVIKNDNDDDLSTVDDTSTSNCLFEHCKKLSLYTFNFHHDINIKFAKRILSSCPNLQNLSFSSSRGLTVNFVQDIASANGIKTLKELDLSDTDIEMLSVKCLLKNASNLKIVTLDCCENFGERQAEYLRNWKPSIKIYCEEVYV